MLLRRGDKLLDALGTGDVAEVGVAELALEHPPLLLLDPPTGLQRQAHHPSEVLVRDWHLGIREQELGQAADGLVHGLDVTPTQRATEMHPALHDGNTVSSAQPVPAFAEEVADEAEMVGHMLGGIQLREVPSGHIGVQAVHEGRVVAHLRGQRAQQMSDPLLLLDVHVQVADHDEAAVGANVLPLPRLNWPDAM